MLEDHVRNNGRLELFLLLCVLIKLNTNDCSGRPCSCSNAGLSCFKGVFRLDTFGSLKGNQSSVPLRENPVDGSLNRDQMQRSGPTDLFFKHPL